MFENAGPTGNPPDWVRDLDDYWTWIERVIDECGGHPDDYLAVNTVEYEGRPTTVLLPTQRILFWDDGSVLTVRLTVNEHLEADFYNFDYRTSDGTLVARLDKHVGHEDIGATHIHFSDDDDPEPAPEYSLEEAISYLRSLRATPSA